MSDTFSKVEVITGVARRRRSSTDVKLAVVAETMQPGMSISYVARRHGRSPSRSKRYRISMDDKTLVAFRGARSLKDWRQLGTSPAFEPEAPIYPLPPNPDTHLDGTHRFGRAYALN